MHVGPQGFGDCDGAVFLLIVFEDGDEGAADGEAGSVEGVYEFGFFVALESDVCAASLEVEAVGAGADFAVGVLPGEPHFEVVCFGGVEAGVAGAERHYAIGEFEFLEDGLRVGGHGFEFVEGVLGAYELDHLDFVELVLAQHAARVLAVGACFGAEAGRVRGVVDWELGVVNDFTGVDVGQRDFCGGNEPEVLIAVEFE